MFKKKRILSLSARENLDGYLFILPWMIGFIFLGAFPIICSLYLAFSKWNIVGEVRWVGLANFKRMFDMTHSAGTGFRKSVVVTLYYCFLSIPLKVIWAIFISLLLRRKIFGQRLFISIFYLPSVISGVSMALMWKWVFNVRGGLINNILKAVGIQGPNWFFQTSTAVPAFTVMSLWEMGFMMIIYLGTLKNIPPEIEESCELDGAGPIRRLFQITLPMISPVIMYQVIMGIISSFQVFVPGYVISGGGEAGQPILGGPKDAFLFYVLNIYRYAFVYLKMGYASALAWILFVVILVFTLLIFKSSPLWTFYRGSEGD